MKFPLTIIFLLITPLLFAQVNLVPNPSFEDTIQCPTGISISIDQLAFATGWYKPTEGTPDYYNSCNNGQVGVPQNIIGWEYAKSGVAYAGLHTSNTGNPGNNYREYIQAKLTDTLIAGIKYYVSFYVCLADSVNYACNSIGAYFSPTAISSTNPWVLPFTPQIANTSANPLIYKNKWTIVADTLTAVGGEIYLTIGNFNDATNSDTIFVGGGSNGFQHISYYYIDDISVYADTADGLNEQDQKKIEVYVFPNPIRNNMTITYNLTDECYFELYNILGAKRKAVTLDNDFKTKSVDLTDIDNGLYFYSVFDSKGDRIKTGKLIVIK